MSGATTNTDIDSAGGVISTKLPGGATLPFPPTPSASIARADDAGVDLFSRGRAASPA